MGFQNVHDPFISFSGLFYFLEENSLNELPNAQSDDVKSCLKKDVCFGNLPKVLSIF